MRLEWQGHAVGGEVGAPWVGNVLSQGGHWALASGCMLANEAQESNHGEAADKQEKIRFVQDQ